MFDYNRENDRPMISRSTEMMFGLWGVLQAIIVIRHADNWAFNISVLVLTVLGVLVARAVWVKNDDDYRMLGKVGFFVALVASAIDLMFYVK